MFKMIKNEIKYKLIKDNKYGVYFSFSFNRSFDLRTYRGSSCHYESVLPSNLRTSYAIYYLTEE